MKKTIYTLLIAVLSVATVSAQRTLTLEECINIALENNLSIKQARNNAISAKAGYTQSKFNFLPSLSAGASHNWNEGLNFDTNSGRLVNTTTLSGGGSVGASMNIFNGFQNHLTLARNRFLYEASEQTVESNIQITEASIVSAFLQVISTKENLKIAEETLGLLKEQQEREEKREKAGVGNMEQVYNFRSQVAQQQLQVVTLQNTLRSGKLTLTQLLLLDPNDQYEFVGISQSDSDLEAEIDAFNDIYEKSMEYSPSVKSAELSLEATKKSFKITQNLWMPTFSVSARYGTSWSSNVVNVLERDGEGNALRTEVMDLNTQFKNNKSKSAGFNLNIPLFTNFRNRTQMQQTKIQVMNAELNVQQAKNTLTNQVQLAYLDLVNAKTSYAAAKESLLNLNTSFEFSKSKYDNGTIDFVTYLQSLNGKNRGELLLVQAKYTILFRKLILDIYTGQLELGSN